MANQNGQLVLQALQDLDEPATVSRIVAHIADTAGVHPNDVKESVLDTLNGGVRYGYIQRANHKYYAEPVELEALVAQQTNQIDMDTDRQDDQSNTGELEERSARRRSKRSRSRSRRRRSTSYRRRRSRR